MNTWWSNYRDYMQDNPEGYWFKRKLYGWGWTPVTWQGWVLLALYVALLLQTVRRGLQVIPPPQEASVVIGYVLIPVIVWTVLLIVICYIKGESPRWQWGLDDAQNKKQPKLDL